MTVTVEVKGLRELEAQLLAIGEEYGPKAALSPVKRALGKAGKVVQASAIARVKRHHKSGTLENNIIVTTYRKPPEGQIGVKVTVRSKAKAYKANSRNVKSGKVGLTYEHLGPLRYGSYLEFGTSASNKRPWATPAYPYMRPAFEENKSTLPGLIRDELAKAIAATVKRLQRTTA